MPRAVRGIADVLVSSVVVIEERDRRLIECERLLAVLEY
jgi:hypothetical protein